MVLKKLLRYFFFSLLGIFGLLILLILFSIAPVDRTPAREFSSYKTTMSRLDSLDVNIPGPRRGFSAGFGKVNLTPAKPMATAGYGPRRGKSYHTVHDSIYVRAVVIENGAQKVAIVSADLLIMPPTVTRVLPEKLRRIGFSLDNTYLSATHSHNSIGHWGEGATRFIYGAYDDAVVDFIADKIVESVAMADGDLLPTTIRSGAVAIPDAVENRLIRGGPEDPYLRVMEFERADSSRAAMVSFTAHATCLSRGTLELSRDYPGAVVDSLEARDYDFAMFLAGAVGSHRGAAPGNDWGCLDWMSAHIAGEFFEHRREFEAVEDSSLVMRRVALSLNDPQVKLGDNWKLRAWVFRSAFGEYDAFLTVLRIGDVAMLGTPCDYSGEFSASLDSVAGEYGLRTMVTSFNGGYIGYVTPGRYYDVNHYETRLMNWYAPGTGDYVQECLVKLIRAVSDTR